MGYVKSIRRATVGDRVNFVDMFGQQITMRLTRRPTLPESVIREGKLFSFVRLFGVIDGSDGGARMVKVDAASECLSM